LVNYRNFTSRVAATAIHTPVWGDPTNIFDAITPEFLGYHAALIVKMLNIRFNAIPTSCYRRMNGGTEPQ